MKRVGIWLLAVLGAALVLSVGVDAIYRGTHGDPYRWPKNIFIHPEIDDGYRLVVLGNSHASDGIALQGIRTRAKSLASVAQSFEYDLAQLKMHSRQIESDAVIVINVSPLSFSQKKAGKEDSLQYNYYDGSLSPFLIPNLNVGDYLQSQVLPFLRSGYLLRKDYNQKVLERIAVEQRRSVEQRPEVTEVEVVEAVEKNETLEKPDAQTSVAVDADEVAKPAATRQRVQLVGGEAYYYNVEGIREILATRSREKQGQLQDSAYVIYNKWYESDGFGTKYFEANRKDLEKLIAYILKKGWRPVLVTIPVSGVLRETLLDDYWQLYVTENMQQTNLQGVEYFDYSNDQRLLWNNALYSNSDHLNEKGAIVFTYLLLRQLIDKGYLPAGADGYDYSPLYKYID